MNAKKELLDTTGDASKRQEGDRHSRGLNIDKSRVHSNVCITHADNNKCTLCTQGRSERPLLYVDSGDTNTKYSVEVLSTSCPSQPNCMPHCEADECHYLCPI